MSFLDNINISENTSFSTSTGNSISQSISLVANFDYQISYHLTVTGSVAVQLGTEYYRKITNDTVVINDTFSHGAGTGSYVMSFDTFSDTTNIIIYAVSLKKIEVPLTGSNFTIKEFLIGTSDEGSPIFFRVDTQILQLQQNPEMYSNPISIATEVERGSMTKAFVNINDKQFYELEGTVTKGISIVKTNSNSDDNIKPPLAQSIQISYRDGSMQLCRIIQMGLISSPTPIDYSQ